MVSITCTNCKAVLTIDDAFVGGVCRCQFCGTIQTVPRTTNRPATPEPVASHAPKALYQNEARVRTAAPSGTGLDELASAVASSSGLSGSGLAQQSQPAMSAPQAAEQPDSHRLMPILVGSSIAIVLLLLLLLVILAWRNSNRSAVATSNSNGTPDIITGPSFCGISVSAPTVIFILDRANSIGDSFDALKATCYKTLKQLGPDRKFQVILWDNDSGSAEFPTGTLRNATAGAIEDCQRDFQDLTASGTSHLSGPLREALDRHPQAIIIVTAKTDLDDDDTAAIKSAAASGTRIDAVQIGAATPSQALEQAAKSTGGQFKSLSPADLRDFSR